MLFNFSCSNDDTFKLKKESSIESEIKNKIISYPKFENKINEKNLEKTFLFKTPQKKVSQKITGSDFYVETSFVREVTLNGNTSFTFVVKNFANENDLTNLIIKEQSNGEVKELLVTYKDYFINYKVNQIYTTEINSDTNINGKNLKTSSNNTCYKSTTKCNYGGIGHYPGHPDCISGTEWYTVLTETPCTIFDQETPAQPNVITDLPNNQNGGGSGINFRTDCSSSQNSNSGNTNNNSQPTLIDNGQNLGINLNFDAIITLPFTTQLSILNLNQSEIEIIKNHPQLEGALLQYLLDNNNSENSKTIAKGILEYLHELAFRKPEEYKKAICGDSNLNNSQTELNEESIDNEPLSIKKLLTKQLLFELEKDPELLTNSCQQRRNWVHLGKHQADFNVKQKINNLNNQNSSWNLQTLNNATGITLNMDYFSVEITEFPIDSATNTRMTPFEFYDHFRRNINDFAQLRDQFTPSTITGYDEATLWNSENPNGAVISINLGTERGSVVCTKYTDTHWIFTTLETPYLPFFQHYDGTHPVSGNREFGYSYDLENNKYIFYTRGIDRMKSKFIEKIAINIYNGIQLFPENQFEGADNLWTSVCDEIERDILRKQGQARSTVRLGDTHLRVDWAEVKDIINGIKPISELKCD